MNREETVKILTMVSALDGRAADEMQVEMWMELFQDHSFEHVKEQIIPAYKSSERGFLSAKAIWDHVEMAKYIREDERKRNESIGN